MKLSNVSPAPASGKPGDWCGRIRQIGPFVVPLFAMRRPFSALIAVFLASLVFLLSPGCATFSKSTDDLAVTLADLRPIEATTFETRLALTVRFTNQSPRPLSLSGSRHALALNGRTVGTAVSAEPLELPALSTQTQEITLNLSNFSLLALVRELQRNPVALYKIESTLFASGAFSRSLRAQQTGTLDLSTLASSPVR
jgi:LEA14-like dessication related protein